MEWSPQQNKAIDAVREFLLGDEQVFRLFGYAGTGKTTLAKHLVKDVDGEVMFAAFTGKAAHVLASKGCDGASTIHKLIYQPKMKSQKRIKQLELEIVELKKIGKPFTQQQLELEEEQENLKRPMFALRHDSPVPSLGLLVIDECSMIDKKIGEDLLSFGTKILVLGDPGQLPPVKGSGFFTDCHPDILLDEIHRQAEGDPIIDLATMARKKKPLKLGEYGKSLVTDKITPELVLAADQVIVGRNATRFSFNHRIRELKGVKEQLPVIGEKLVCLRNNHDLGLLNGAIFIVHDIETIQDEKIMMCVKPEGTDKSIEVIAHTHHFLGEKIPFYEINDAEEFDFAYAITCHKSQGSQWDNVLLYDESDCFKGQSHKWLYTGITRAAESITIVKH